MILGVSVEPCPQDEDNNFTQNHHRHRVGRGQKLTSVDVLLDRTLSMFSNFVTGGDYLDRDYLGLSGINRDYFGLAGIISD